LAAFKSRAAPGKEQMKLRIQYQTLTNIGFNGELDDKMKVFFSALGFIEKGSGSGGGWRDVEYERENEECNGCSLDSNGEASQPPTPTVL
jgi:hypothetical protein